MVTSHSFIFDLPREFVVCIQKKESSDPISNYWLGSPPYKPELFRMHIHYDMHLWPNPEYFDEDHT